MTDCDYCENRPGVYNFNNICCRVRFICSIPVRELRTQWIARWRKKYGDELADEVERRVKVEWAKRVGKVT